VRDFLSGADLGERAEGGSVKIQGERFMVSVEFLSERHSQAPIGPPTSRVSYARFCVTVENRAYHYLSQPEIDGVGRGLSNTCPT